MMRVTMGSRPGELGATHSPVGLRLLNTMPLGCPLPILEAMRWAPSGVRQLPFLSPRPNLEVLTG